LALERDRGACGLGVEACGSPRQHRTGGTAAGRRPRHHGYGAWRIRSRAIQPSHPCACCPCA
jgi:hypothetical protein